MTVIVLPRDKTANYKTERVVKAKADDKSEQKPGYLTWGDTGDLPKPTPTGIDFTVEFPNEQTELSRKTEDIRIENPDDPDQYVIAKRTKQLIFDQTTNTGGNNSDTGGEDFGDFAPSPIQLTNFAPLGTSTKGKKLKVTFRKDDGTI